VVTWLTANGAIREHNIAQLRSTPEFHTAVSQALPLLCERGQWDYVEAWVPSDITNEKIQSNEWYSVKSKVGVYSQLRKNVEEMFAPQGGAVHNAVKTLKPVWFNGLPGEQDIGSERVKALKGAGVNVKSGLVLPVYRNERILACFLFLSEEDVAARNAENRAKWTEAFSSFAIGMLSSSLFKSDEPMFGSIPGIPSGQMASVYRKIIEEGVFNAQVVYQEVDWYYKAGLQQVRYILIIVRSDSEITNLMGVKFFIFYFSITGRFSQPLRLLRISTRISLPRSWLRPPASPKRSSLSSRPPIRATVSTSPMTIINPSLTWRIRSCV
jgi:hypothetical protein